MRRQRARGSIRNNIKRFILPPNVCSTGTKMKEDIGNGKRVLIAKRLIYAAINAKAVLIGFKVIPLSLSM